MTPDRDLFPAGAPGSITNPLRLPRRPGGGYPRLRLHWVEARDSDGVTVHAIEVTRDRWVRVRALPDTVPDRDEVAALARAYRRGHFETAHVASTAEMRKRLGVTGLRVLPPSAAYAARAAAR